MMCPPDGNTRQHYMWRRKRAGSARKSRVSRTWSTSSYATASGGDASKL